MPALLSAKRTMDWHCTFMIMLCGYVLEQF